ncbi:MAG TPA: ankyrin repeat domain-containing protein [Pyrinomonadaceae bacterium]|jgi:ankyrin repeat protein|nr:ankyrin repeat domain-containing protein [Pyrinomonadaceae bacterium]
MSQEFLDAASGGDVSKVKAMLAVDPALARAKDENGVSAIMKATYYGKRDVVAALLESGVELDVFEAAATGRSERLVELIEKDPSLANAYSPDGFTPLGFAVFFAQPRIVEALLNTGADVNLPSRESMKVTPLASAAAAKQTEIARLLIAHGANVNARAASGHIPLHEAAGNGNVEMVKLLIENGADVNARTDDGKTPLDFAIEYKRTEVIDLLKES